MRGDIYIYIIYIYVCAFQAQVIAHDVGLNMGQSK